MIRCLKTTWFCPFSRDGDWPDCEAWRRRFLPLFSAANRSNRREREASRPNETPSPPFLARKKRKGEKKYIFFCKIPFLVSGHGGVWFLWFTCREISPTHARYALSLSGVWPSRIVLIGRSSTWHGNNKTPVTDVVALPSVRLKKVAKVCVTEYNFVWM